MIAAESVETPAAAAASRRVGTGVLLGGLVVVSAVVQFLAAGRAGAPRIFGDEFIYAELAKSFADTGELALRGVPTNGYGVLYPVLIAPAFALFDRIPDAYAAVKAINAVVMSLTAVPVYFLARRVAGRWAALLAAALSLLVPSTAYTATIMTENLFYPLFCVFALALASMLERPTPARQCFVLLAAAAAFACRAHGVALVGALVLAIAAWCWLDGAAAGAPLRQRLAAFRVIWAVLGAGLVTTAIALPLLGRSATDPLGAYEAAVTGVDPPAVAGWLVAHLAVLALSVGVVPLAVLPLALRDAMHRPAATVATRALAVTTVSIGAAMLFAVAVFAATPYGLDRLHERNVFYVSALVFALLSFWLDRGRPVPSRVRLALGAAAVLSLVAIPFERAEGSAVSDALSLVVWLELAEGHAPRAALVMIVAAFLVLLGVALPRRLAGIGLAAIAIFMVFTGMVARAGGENGAVALAERQDWIDAVAGDGAVLAVYVDVTSCLEGDAVDQSRQSHWQTAFFNRRVTDVAAVGSPSPDGLPARIAEIRAGTLTEAGSPVRARLVAADARLGVVGRVLAEDAGTGMQLVQTRGTVRFSRIDDGRAARGRLCDA